jgi:hypothetical protein
MLHLAAGLVATAGGGEVASRMADTCATNTDRRAHRPGHGPPGESESSRASAVFSSRAPGSARRRGWSGMPWQGPGPVARRPTAAPRRPRTSAPCRGLSNNGTASGDSELKTAGLPRWPFRSRRVLAAIRICPLAATKMAVVVITESERVACTARCESAAESGACSWLGGGITSGAQIGQFCRVAVSDRAATSCWPSPAGHEPPTGIAARTRRRGGALAAAPRWSAPGSELTGLGTPSRPVARGCFGVGGPGRPVSRTPRGCGR